MRYSRFSAVTFFISLLCYAQLSYAGSSFDLKERTGERMPQKPYSDFIVSLPRVTTAEVLQHISNVKSALNRRKATLSQTEQERQFTIKDSAISILLPGGLLYAAIIKLRHAQAKDQLYSVVRQIDELNQELAEFRSSSIDNTLLATLH